MSRHELYGQPENLNDLIQVAELQRSLGTELADIYSTGSAVVRNSAEVVLRNPTVYLNDASHSQLSEGLQAQWLGLLDLSSAVVDLASTEDKAWPEDASGIEKLQSLLYTGHLKSFQRSIADIMEMSSKLFAESIRELPGNSDYIFYYSGNVQTMQTCLLAYKQSK